MGDAVMNFDLIFTLTVFVALVLSMVNLYG